MALMQSVKKFIRDEEGVVTIEYALVAALVGIGLIVVLAAYRKDISDLFKAIGVSLNTVEVATNAVASPVLNTVP